VSTIHQRILKKIELTKSGCWAWNASKYKNGYGQVWNGFRTEQAHRVTYKLYIGPIPEGHEIDHICRNRGCVNPAHLRCVTHKENIRCSGAIMGDNARKTHCKRGHPLSGDNLKVCQDGARQCRTCLRMHARNAKARRRDVGIL
jgi:hypothetical protein